MTFYTDDSPIIACSTGMSSNTAISVIRLSGFDNLFSLQNYFSFNLNKVTKRTSHLSNILNNDQVLDNILFVFFPKGESYTGENVLELSVHGNLLNVQRILDLFILSAKFRSAHPGEFTYRALINKKLSLSQVEGLDMLLNANSTLMLTQGLDILQGDLHAQYLALYNSYLSLKAAVEISIDFSEDVGTEETQKLFTDSFNNFYQLISSLKSRTEGNTSSLLSPEIVLVGQTNAGKSSLFNLLLKHNRSIVSDIAGTTRDYVSELVHIEGINFKLVDTAGVRESNDVIENIGIERAMDILSRAFYKILIVNPFETNADYLAKFSHIDFDILIISHSDKTDFQSNLKRIDFSFIKTHFLAKSCFLTNKSGSIEPLEIFGPMGPVLLFNGPIEPLKISGPIEPVEPFQICHGPIEPLLKSLILKKFQILSANNPILLERHRASINKIYLKSVHFSSNIEGIGDVAILSSEVNILGHDLAELVGILSPDDVLNSIFSNFCIGK